MRICEKWENEGWKEFNYSINAVGPIVSNLFEKEADAFYDDMKPMHFMYRGQMYRFRNIEEAQPNV